MLKNNNFSNLDGLYHLYCKMGKTCHCTLQNLPSTTRLVTTVVNFFIRSFHTPQLYQSYHYKKISLNILTKKEKSGYKADLIRSYKQLINEMS